MNTADDLNKADELKKADGKPLPVDVPVTVLGGYLGAGKTTVLNHLLRTANERIVVLVNDFGSINIDEDLIETTSDDKITLANGCICCSLVDGLAAALAQVRLLDPRPARLVIEASGVADPASIAAYAHGGGLELDSVVTVVDAETIRVRSNDPYVGDTVIRQLRAADLIVVNKADLVSAEQLAGLEAWLAAFAGSCPTITALHGRVSIDVVLGPVPDREAMTGLRDDSIRMGASVSHDAESLFVSWNAVLEDRCDGELLRALVASWPSDVLRVKGVIRTRGSEGGPDIRTVIHRVGNRVTARDEGQWRGGPSRVIGIGLLGVTNVDELSRSVQVLLLTPPV